MIKKFSFLNHFEEVVGTVSLAIMVTIAFINVLTRYFFRYSMAFTEELTLYLFVWATLMGACIAFREGNNIAVSFFYDRFGGRARKVFDILSAALSLTFFAVLCYYGVLEVMDEIMMDAKTEAIELPIWWFTSAMPIASVLIMIRILIRTRMALSASVELE